jgi:DeoR/GlpR family transcriptional regulator of sugar metabolism
MREDGEAEEGGQRLIAEERHRRIEELLRRQAVASVAEVIEVTGASEATVRRDLVLLERLGLLARTRGGARAARRHSTLEEEFEIRRSRDRREKRLIAQGAVDLVEDGMTLFITDGTTSYALAQCLVHRHLTVITGALNIAQLLAGSAAIEVIVLGGQLRATSFGTTGPLSVDTIRSLHADLAFIAADGVTLDGGVRAFSLDDAASARAMSESAARTVVLASPAKIGNPARARVIGWSRVDAFVATRLPAEFAKGLEQQGVHVIAAT